MYQLLVFTVFPCCLVPLRSTGGHSCSLDEGQEVELVGQHSEQNRRASKEACDTDKQKGGPRQLITVQSCQEVTVIDVAL